MKRSIALVLLAGLVASACGGVGLPGFGTGPKVGMVTDIGQLEDKSFNEFSWKGVQDGAKAIGGTATAVVTKDTADYAANIQSLVDQKFDVIVTVGFLIGTDTLKAAQANPTIQFFGIDQFVADPAPANYQGLLFAENQAGYLAGIVAANITKTNKIGAVGGVSAVPPVVAFIKGYEAAAKAEKPNIQVIINYTESFTEPEKGDASAKAMISQGADVIFQVAGLTGAGALRAACSANVWGIGVDVDQYLSLPDAQKCIVTSAEKKLEIAAADALKRWKSAGKQTGNFFNDAKNNGIGVSPIRNTTLPAGVQAKLDKALADMKAGTLNPPSK
jgi:basic membrane protein A